MNGLVLNLVTGLCAHPFCFLFRLAQDASVQCQSVCLCCGLNQCQTVCSELLHLWVLGPDTNRQLETLAADIDKANFLQHLRDLVNNPIGTTRCCRCRDKAVQKLSENAVLLESAVLGVISAAIGFLHLKVAAGLKMVVN